jgi:hypothetical protein
MRRTAGVLSALTAVVLVLVTAGCSFLLGDDGIPTGDYNDTPDEPTVLFLWEQGDGLSPWTLDGNGQGVGSVEIDAGGRLSFQVDFDALRDVRTPSYDLRNSTVDIRFYVTNGTGYSAMGIANLDSATSYSVGNEFAGSFLIRRDTVYYLRTEFDSQGNYTRLLSTSGFGDDNVRRHTGSLTEAQVSDRIVRIHMNNSHNASTNLKVEYVEVLGGSQSGGGGDTGGGTDDSNGSTTLDTARVRLTNSHGETTSWTTIDFEDGIGYEYDVEYNLGSGWVESQRQTQ